MLTEATGHYRARSNAAERKSSLRIMSAANIGNAIEYLVVAFFGGTTPYMITLLASYHREDLYFAYLAVIAAIALVTYVHMPETRGKSLDR